MRPVSRYRWMGKLPFGFKRLFAMGLTSYADRRVQLALFAAALSCGVVHGAEPTLETLPVGAISTSETSGVSAEICRDHLFDATSSQLKLPTGYRLRSAGEISLSDPAIAELIRLNPELKSYAFGSLCFMSMATFVVDERPVITSGTMPAAFWWAAAEGPPHADMRGKVRWVQIGSWYSKDSGHQVRIRRTDPMAQFTKIEVKPVSPDAWHLSLVLPSETVEADIRTTSPSTPRKASGPDYMSVPMSGDSAEYFSVYAYAGHRIREANGDWRTTGTGIFTAAFAIPKEASAFATLFQEGWTARSGLYRFSQHQ
jgi:hypothetical protein